MTTLVYGIRHHGPGSARSVRAALAGQRPDIVLIEGPPEADDLVTLAADPDMRPPVALLGYVPGEPRQAAFWPFAVFSPEWQAITYALAAGVPVRFCDLPAAHQLALKAAGTEQPEPPGPRRRTDPVSDLAAAAGYDDPERWWEDLIESRLDGRSPFAALTEAMALVRAASPSPPDEQRREAYMRQMLRAALRDTARAGAGGPVAVVCGAWHAPALAGKLPPAAADTAVLRGLPKRKTALAWVPWTHARLAAASGYGAGITSPGWYHHLFTTPEHTVIRWLTRVAGVLRAHDLPVSSAHIIEAARLADALATLRGRPLAGLAEVSEATEAVLCDGDPHATGFITRDLVVGERLGTVPDTAPAVPLEADLRAQARAARLRLDPAEQSLTLDLRSAAGRARSVLLHRLTVLGIGWGTAAGDQVRRTGTFRETWALRWRPELVVAVIDAAPWGTTVAAAATSKIIDAARTAGDVAGVSAAVEGVLLADLPGALSPVLRALDEKAARDADVARLMTAVPALVRAARYGDVRGTGTGALATVTDALTTRVCAGLPAAVTSLADDAAARLRSALDGMHAALSLHAQDDQGRATRDRWIAALTLLAARADVHGLLTGRVVRLLTDAGVLAQAEAARRLAAHLSIGVPAAGQAAWVDGFLSGSGLLLVHDRDLLGILDDWLASLGDQDFTAVLPLLRRTFGGFAGPELAHIGHAARQLTGGAPAGPGATEPVDAGRAAGALRTVAAILGAAR